MGRLSLRLAVTLDPHRFRSAFDSWVLAFDHGTHAILDRAYDCFHFTIDALLRLRGLLLGYAIEFTGFARCLHLHVTDQLAKSAPDFAAKLFRSTFYAFAVIPHCNVLGLRTALASCSMSTELAIAVPTGSSKVITPFSHAVEKRRLIYGRD
jgi:hypothetical protein